jgi:uncharacterized integral membrane protein (TIGR00698 family)
MSTVSNKPILHEDWTAVFIGFSIIVFSLSGLIFAAPSYSWNSLEELFTKVFSGTNLVKLIAQFFYVYVLGIIAVYLIGKRIKNFLLVFPVIYALTTVALLIAGNSFIKGINLEAVIFSLLIGLIIGNVFKLPDWFREAQTTEFFVKTGLVLLGTTVIFSDILKAGLLGLVQALVVVLSVWYFAFWVCKKLKVDEELTLMISSAVSICGVSAAIATSGAINGDSRKLSYVISMVLITAIPMMIGMPYAAAYLGLSQEVTGAWLGGSIDTSGAVVASGTLVGEIALKISTIVKFSQNVLLGIAAFAISVYWTLNKKQDNAEQKEKPSLLVIWERFPKFVLGFIVASLLFSFALSSDVVEEVKGSLKNLQTLWFVLAFTSIGLETNFADLFNGNSKKPLYAFLIAQTFNIIVTLILAYLLFS